MIQDSIIPAIFILVSGMWEGIMDHTNFHNTSNNYFWGQTSWLNKYRNRDSRQPQTFKGKYFTFLCDGWHLSKTFRNLFLFSAFAIKLDRPKEHWYHYLIEGVCYWAINRIGFNALYLTLK
jgi:hypothetical protein